MRFAIRKRADIQKVGDGGSSARWSRAFESSPSERRTVLLLSELAAIIWPSTITSTKRVSVVHIHGET